MDCSLKRTLGGRAWALAALTVFVFLAATSAAAGAASGSRLWARTYTLTPPVFEGGWSAVAGDGSFFVCGAHVVQASPFTIMPYVVKYSRGGARRWVWEQSFINYPSAYVRDIGVDRYGNAYVCGTLMFTASDWDLLLVKLSPAGQIVWYRIWEPSPGRKEAASALVVTATGAVYLAGSAEDSMGHGADMLYMRWTKDGSLSWVWVYDEQARDNSATDIALDGGGGLVVTGTTETAAGDTDCLTMRVAAKTGTVIGSYPVQRYAAAAGGDERVPKVECGPNRTAYVALESDGGAARGMDIVILKYRADGKRSWTRRYDGPAHLDESLAALAVDKYGSVFVAGATKHASAPDESALAIRYTGGGRRVWVRRYRQKVVGRSGGYANVVLDRSQRPYFGGTLGDGDAADVLLAAYSRTGKLRWRRTYDGKAHLGDGAASLAAYGTATLYVSGATQTGPSDYRGLVLKYRQ